MRKIDVRVIERAKKGDSAACEELSKECRPIASRLSRALVHSTDVEDATQDCLVALLVGLESYEERGHFEAWFVRVCVNVCRNYRRRLRCLYLEELPRFDIIDPRLSPEEMTMLNNQLDRLKRELSSCDWLIFWFTYGLGMTSAEVKRRLPCQCVMTESTVRTRLSRHVRPAIARLANPEDP